MIRLSKDLPKERKHKYIEHFREFKYVFAWKYEDLKTYDTSIIQHKIPLKPSAKPFVQKLWQINPILLPTIEKEIRKLFDEKIIIPLKENYPLPKMDHVLQKLLGATRISMMDGFLGYNQVAMHTDDMENTAFTTPWGTFTYQKMPFGLINVGATFQRAMDIEFVGEKDKFIVIFLDDMTVFSTSDEDHIKHL